MWGHSGGLQCSTVVSTVLQCRRIGWSYCCECVAKSPSSPYNSTAGCIFCGCSASSARSVARSSINYTSQHAKYVCTRLLCCYGVYLTPHRVQHCNAAPSFSEHTYDIPLRDILGVIFWVRGPLCCTLKGCMHSIGRSTALTPIGLSKSRVHYTPLTVTLISALLYTWC